MARFVHLNGPPGIGKSTLAALHAEQHPGTLNLDVDTLHRLVGGWQDEETEAIGVRDSWFLPLGLVKIAGALGLLAGIAYRPLGIAAAIGVVLYFLGAVITHLRAGDKKGVGVPAVIMLVAAAPLVLGLATV